MKTKSVIPEKDNVLKIAQTITTTPIAGTFFAIYPNPGTIVFSYISPTTIYANLLRPPKPGVTPSSTGCGDYARVLEVAHSGDFAMMYTPGFAGKLLRNTLKQIARTCNVMDDIGVYWLVKCKDSQFVRELFREHNIRYRYAPSSDDLIITNYEETASPVQS